MHHPTHRIAHTTAFVTPVVEHWLEREIAQWVHPMKDRSDDPPHHERTLYLWATSHSLKKRRKKNIETMHNCVTKFEMQWLWKWESPLIFFRSVPWRSRRGLRWGRDASAPWRCSSRVWECSERPSGLCLPAGRFPSLGTSWITNHFVLTAQQNYN